MGVSGRATPSLVFLFALWVLEPTKKRKGPEETEVLVTPCGYYSWQPHTSFHMEIVGRARKVTGFSIPRCFLQHAKCIGARLSQGDSVRELRKGNVWVRRGITPSVVGSCGLCFARAPRQWFCERVGREAQVLQRRSEGRPLLRNAFDWF